MGSVLLFAFVVGIGVWAEALCRVTLVAIGTRDVADWRNAALIALSPALPIAGSMVL
jgi:hypothetical protein